MKKRNLVFGLVRLCVGISSALKYVLQCTFVIFLFWILRDLNWVRHTQQDLNYFRTQTDRSQCIHWSKNWKLVWFNQERLNNWYVFQSVLHLHKVSQNELLNCAEDKKSGILWFPTWWKFDELFNLLISSISRLENETKQFKFLKV